MYVGIPHRRGCGDFSRRGIYPIVSNDVEERELNNKVAMEKTDEAFAVVDDGVAAMIAVEPSDYSGGKANKSGLVYQMNSQAHASVGEAIQKLDKEITRLGDALDVIRARRADALIGLEAINVALRYLEEHGGAPDVTEAEDEDEEA